MLSTLFGLPLGRSERPAILAPGREPLSERRLHEQLESARAALRSRGIGRGDCVAGVLRTGPEAATALIAISTTTTYAPLNPGMRDDELAWCLSQLAPKAVVVDAADGLAAVVARTAGLPVMELLQPAGAAAGEFVFRGHSARARAATAPVAPEDIALILSTSGTTNRPKLVQMTHRSIDETIGALVRFLALTSEDRCLNFSPLFHTLGINGGVLAPLAGGGSTVLAPAFDRDRFFEWLEELSPTWYSAVPTIHQTILEHAPKHREILARQRIRFMRSGGAPLPPSVCREIEGIFRAPLLQVYGMAEAPVISMDHFPPRLRKSGSVGTRASNAVAIMDDDGRPLPDGSTGEVVVSGPTVTPGYLNHPAATADAFLNGWFRTGDLGFFDADGFLFLTGRRSEFINRGGEKIAPAEVDEALLDHPAVRQAVAFPVPDPKLGQEIAAAVVLRAPVSESELQAFAATRLAAHRVPRRILVVEEIPQGPTGKIRRTGMAEALGLTMARPEGANPSTAPRDNHERKLAVIWAEVLDVESVDPDDNFFDLGGDSLLAAVCLARIREEFALPPLSPLLLLHAPTLSRMAALLAEPARLNALTSIVPVQPRGHRLPLFVISPGLEARRLAQHLGSDYPVFGINPPNLEFEPPPHSIESIASHSVECLKRFRPHGPYALCGWCLEGVIAFEMARQLDAQGDEVALVALIDSRDLCPPPLTGAARVARSAQRTAARVESYIGRMARADAVGVVRELRRAALGIGGRQVQRLWRLAYRFYASRGQQLPAPLRNHDRAQRAALRAYRPQPFHRPLVHIWAHERPRLFFPGVEYWWGHVAHGGIVFREVPGHHMSVFEEPAVAVLARHLSEQLAATETRLVSA